MFSKVRTALLLLAVLAVARAAAGPLKVFILAGQSNMEGQAVVDLDGPDYNDGKGTLVRVLADPTAGARFGHLRTPDGKWATRDDVWVRFRPGNGPVRTGPLGIGFTPYGDAHHFGPELQFGHVLGDALPEPVLLVKTAWGGKSLHRDFRPPSSGGEVGPSYRRMLAEVREALANLSAEFPSSRGLTPELAGLVWYQGWNDGVDPAGAVPEYESNLVNLVRDLRRDLGVPDLPVVVGELTGPWVDAPPGWEALRRAQAAASARAEFAGTVRFVPTRSFVRKPGDSPNPGHGHHEFGNAETCLRVGDALGRAMVALLESRAAGDTTRTVEGWTVRVRGALWRDQRESTETALALLGKQLAEVVRVVPAPAVARLREVPLWFSPQYPGVPPRAEYHPDAGWLLANRRDPSMAKAVEFTDVRDFAREMDRMPNFALHELAHAYHDRVLGFSHPGIRAAYVRAKAGGGYDRVERRLGNGRPNTFERAYAMADDHEYFAECTEAYFSRNDFFPFTRDDLERHDPGMAALLRELWNTAADHPR